MSLSVNLERNIGWLLENGSPPVRYLTHRVILGKPPHSDEMKSLWRHVEEFNDVQEIFDRQRDDGSWCSGGSWALKPSYIPKDGYDPYNPKYVTTVWILPLLGEMGFTVQDERIRKACEYTLSHGYFSHRQFHESTESPDYVDVDFSPCRFSQYMIALGSVGFRSCSDFRVKQGYQVLLNEQRGDGGWALKQHIIQRNWTRSCPFSSYHGAMALYHSGDQSHREHLVKALAFLAWHLSTKDDSELCRFFYHGHSTVRELLMLSEYRIGLRERAIRTLLRWLMTMYRADEGRFQYTGKPISRYSRRKDGMDTRVAKYRLYHLIEDDWLTYYMTRICANLSREGSDTPDAMSA